MSRRAIDCMILALIAAIIIEQYNPFMAGAAKAAIGVARRIL